MGTQDTTSLLPERIALPAELTIASCRALHALLTDAQDAPGGIAVDAGAVATVDTAGLQLLVVVDRYLAERGSTLAIVDAPSAIIQGLATLGLGDALTLSPASDEVPGRG